EPEPFRVAVVGRHSLEFAATVRAVSRAGATAAPVDASAFDAEELTALFAEAQVHMAVSAGSGDATMHEAARCLGKPAASAENLAAEGSASDVPGPDDSKPSMMLFAQSPLGGSRAAEVPEKALTARLARANSAWNFAEEDVVLSLGLDAGDATSLVDALEAPLAAGAAVELAQVDAVWDLWSTLESTTATVVFLDSRWCWQLAQTHGSLAAPVRANLQARSRDRPFRHMVAVAPAGTVLSE
ncbi:unnamed protein product, partial [Effrenium voratum]